MALTLPTDALAVLVCGYRATTGLQRLRNVFVRPPRTVFPSHLAGSDTRC